MDIVRNLNQEGNRGLIKRSDSIGSNHIDGLYATCYM